MVMIIDTRPAAPPHHKCEEVLVDGEPVALIFQWPDTNDWQIYMQPQRFNMTGSKEAVLGEIAFRLDK